MLVETRAYSGKNIVDLVSNGRYVVPTKYVAIAIHKTIEADQINNISPDFVAFPANTALSVGYTYFDSSNLFVVTSAGTTGSSEPTWNTTVGDTTTDNTVTWTTITENACAALVNIYGIPRHDESKSDRVLLSSQRLNIPSTAGQECSTVIALDSTASGYEAIQIEMDHEGIDSNVYLQHILTEYLEVKGTSSIKTNFENEE